MPPVELVTLTNRPAEEIGVSRPAPVPELQPDYIDRDLSWVEFNRRVLHQAKDPRTPLLERVRFMAIFTSNLDEFFMKRIGRLRREVLTGNITKRPEELNPSQVLNRARHKIVQLLAEQHRTFGENLLPELREVGIHLLRWEELTDSERAWANRYF